jgi:hypothetical protein
MSTRGCIARLTGSQPWQFRGVYHHWDSYPSGLGRALFRGRNWEFAREAGVFTTVSSLVAQLSDNPAARMTAQEIAQRVQQAQSQRTTGQAVAAN